MDPLIKYINLDLWIERASGGGYEIRVHSSHGGDHDVARGDFAQLGAQDERLADDGADPPYAKAIGVRQYQFLFETATKARIKTVLDRCLGATEDSREAERNAGVRIRIQLSETNPEIAAVPWEFLYSEADDEFLATSNHTPIVRFLEVRSGMRPPEARLPLKLLVAIPTVPNLDVDAEKRCIREALEGIDPPVAVTFLDGNVTRERLSNALTKDNSDFLHFSGHGRFQDGHGALRLNRSEFEEDWITGPELRELVKNIRSLKLVVLNTCSGAETSTCDAFVGLAPHLVRAGIPAVVAMQFPIRDDEAKTFASGFYQALFQGAGRGSVDVAITAARSALSRDFHGRRAIGVPVLYARYDQGVLFKVVRDKAGRRPTSLKPEEAAKDEALVREATRAIERLEGGDPVELAEQEEIRARAAARLRFCRWAIATPVAVTLMLILAVTTRLFETYVPLGPIVAASPVWFGDPLASMLPVDSVALVTTQEFPVDSVAPVTMQDSIRQDSVRAVWRFRHAELLTRLSQAGARVVAFDIRFRVPSNADSAMSAAVDAARQRGTLVVGGSNRQQGDSLALAPALMNRMAPGMDCLGENPFLFSGVVPLVWLPAGSQELLPSFSLAVVAASRRSRVDFDPTRSELTTVNSGGTVTDHVKLTRMTTLLRSQPGCPIMRSGGRYGEMLAVRAPLEAWRDHQRNFDYAAVLAAPPERLAWARNRIVLVGAVVRPELSSRRIGFRTDRRYGVERHADAIVTILGNAAPRAVPRGLEYLLVAALAALGSVLSYRGPRPRLPRATLMSAGTFAGLAGLAVLLYWTSHRLLDILYPFASFLLTFILLLRLRRRWFP